MTRSMSSIEGVYFYIEVMSLTHIAVKGWIICLNTIIYYDFYFIIISCKTF